MSGARFPYRGGVYAAAMEDTSKTTMTRSEVAASPFVTLGEAAAYARCHSRTIRRWIQAGDLARYGHGGKVLVLRTDLEALLAAARRERDAP